MKIMTPQQEEEIKMLEEKADELMSSHTFDACLDAISAFIQAQEKLAEYVNDDASQPDEASSEHIRYKIWRDKLLQKTNDAQQMLFNAKSFNA